MGRARETKRRSEKRKSQKKEEAGVQNCRKDAIHWFFNDFQMRDDSLHAAATQAHVEIKMHSSVVEHFRN